MNRLTLFINLIAPVLLLILISLLILNSLDSNTFYSQLTFILAGFVIFISITNIPYHLFTFSPWPWYVLTILVLGITLIFGESIRGSTRWLNLFGISIQTSELIKPFIVLFCATYINQYNLKHWPSLLKLIALSSAPLALIFIQPDLGTVITISIMFAAALVAGGTSFKKLLSLLLIIMLTIPLGLTLMRPYQRDRLESFFDPSSDPLGASYNAVQAVIAIGSGGLWGRGLGQGTQSQLQFLPERQTDFIYASLVEELGMAGGILVILSYAWLARGLIFVARRSDTQTGSLITLITLSTLIFQVTVNIGMNLKLLPITGITLPFVSAGGSSVISFTILIALTTAVAKQARSKPSLLELK